MRNGAFVRLSIWGVLGAAALEARVQVMEMQIYIWAILTLQPG